MDRHKNYLNFWIHRNKLLVLPGLKLLQHDSDDNVQS